MISRIYLSALEDPNQGKRSFRVHRPYVTIDIRLKNPKRRRTRQSGRVNESVQWSSLFCQVRHPVRDAAQVSQIASVASVSIPLQGRHSFLQTLPILIDACDTAPQAAYQNRCGSSDARRSACDQNASAREVQRIVHGTTSLLSLLQDIKSSSISADCRNHNSGLYVIGKLGFLIHSSQNNYTHFSPC